MKNRKARDRRMLLEQLDRRELMAVDLRSFDGTGNNLANPQWGSTEERFLRVAAAEYGDGIASPAGSDRMSARAISNIIAAQGDTGLVNDRDLSAMAYAWGQFLDHDIDLTNTSDKHELFSIAVPKGDPGRLQCHPRRLWTSTRKIVLRYHIECGSPAITEADLWQCG